MKIEQIWEEYNIGIRKFLLSRVSDPILVDDLSQDIWVKVFNNLHTLNSEESVKSWMFQIANRAIIDFYRKSGKTIDFDFDNLPDNIDEPEAFESLANCIVPFIKELPQEESKLLMSIEIDGISQKEYAEKNNINYSTPKSRVQKSRLNLKGVFENCCKFALNSQGGIMDCVPKTKSCRKC